MTTLSITFCKTTLRLIGIEHTNPQYEDIMHNNSQHNNSQRNNSQHNNSQHNNNHHNDPTHNDTIDMKRITRCKLALIFTSADHRKFL